MSLAWARQQRVEDRKGRVPGEIGYFIVRSRYGCKIGVSIVALIEQDGGRCLLRHVARGVKVAQLSGHADHSSRSKSLIFQVCSGK